jgi:predicted RNA binding protein YcfA (HicA-like mRNA interferase family)
LPKLRRLSGKDAAAILADFGFRVVSQRGSHMKLRRIGDDGTRQTLTIPVHAQLATGTLNAIVRQASRFVRPDDLRRRFFGP